MHVFNGNTRPKRVVKQTPKAWKCPQCQVKMARYWLSCPECGSRRP